MHTYWGDGALGRCAMPFSALYKSKYLLRRSRALYVCTCVCMCSRTCVCACTCNACIWHQITLIVSSLSRTVYVCALYMCTFVCMYMAVSKVFDLSLWRSVYMHMFIIASCVCMHVCNKNIGNSVPCVCMYVHVFCMHAYGYM